MERQKGIAYCGPACVRSLLDKIHIQAFARFVIVYSTDLLLRCLEKNDKNEIIHYYPNKLADDYDTPKTAAEIIDMILNGKRYEWEKR